MADLGDFQRMLDRASQTIPDKLPMIIEVEGLNFIKMNFRQQSYTDTSRKNWVKRKTTDKDGNDLTRYRTNRRGTRGSLTKFGQREKGRAILVGHNTGGNKLSNSFRARRTRQRVVFYTYKKYGDVHNEGKGDMPQRQFMGKSKYLDDRIETKVNREMDKAMRG